MSETTDCSRCGFRAACPLVDKFQRLPREEGGLGACPKLAPTQYIRCRSCLFCARVYTNEWTNAPRGEYFTCRAMGDFSKLRSDGKLPRNSPRRCPIKQIKKELKAIAD